MLQGLYPNHFLSQTGKAEKERTRAEGCCGVTCYTPNRCVEPPAGGTNCLDGDLKLLGDDKDNGEGVLEYCYKGLWSGFCSLGERESTVVCRQLGYVDFASKTFLTIENHNYYCYFLSFYIIYSDIYIQ